MYASKLLANKVSPVAKWVMIAEANTDAPKSFCVESDGTGYRDIARSECSARELGRPAFAKVRAGVGWNRSSVEASNDRGAKGSCIGGRFGRWTRVAIGRQCPSRPWDGRCERLSPARSLVEETQGESLRRCRECGGADVMGCRVLVERRTCAEGLGREPLDRGRRAVGAGCGKSNSRNWNLTEKKICYDHRHPSQVRAEADRKVNNR